MPAIRSSLLVMYRSVDMQGTIQDCNQYYAVRMGYTLDEVMGSSILDHSPEKTCVELRFLLEEWKTAPATHISRQIQLKTKTGEVVDVVQTVRRRYENEKMVGIDVEMRDLVSIRKIQRIYNIAARKDYEDPKLMRRSVDYLGTIVHCNQTYLDKLGYTMNEVLGISLYEHTAPRSKGNLHANMENWRAGFRDTCKLWMRRKDGGEFPVILVSTDETDEEGEVMGRTVTLQPVDH